MDLESYIHMYTHLFCMHIDFTKIYNQYPPGGLAGLHWSRRDDSANEGPGKRILRNDGSSTALSSSLCANGILSLLFVSLWNGPTLGTVTYRKILPHRFIPTMPPNLWYLLCCALWKPCLILSFQSWLNSDRLLCSLQNSAAPAHIV